MVSDADRERLAALEKRIETAKAAAAPRRSAQEDNHRQAQLAWRMVIELVAGLMIGFCIGYALDYLLGTMPLFLVIFILAGFAAGVKTMLRSAKEMQAKSDASATDPQPKATSVADDEEED
ncbi:MAG: synthase subunit [Cypionkella sp.]|uniref:AtpZ/AtpI family protein n=1 Tax=Cypionkella sp. TaxID=2811411 RepID=UPI002628D4D7|nr:AtpZ/AtpI family protein [Cypionkella sp.]MDB5658771.1 synthase subunit [Cypionkella sp.]MDB5663491.1 synthase subunit [Cypionkella sp.]